MLARETLSRSEINFRATTRLREPLDWRDLGAEPHARTSRKVARARELGVVAVLFTAEEVNHRINDLVELERRLNGDQVDRTIYAGIMKGGVPFVSKFFTRFASLQPHMNPVVDYIQASRYGDSQTGGDVLQIKRKLDPGTDINGMRFVSVEDTIDEGITLELLGQKARNPEGCTDLGDGVTGPAADTGIITLTDKRIADMPSYETGSILRGMWVPNVWIGGNGLDGANEALRWIPELVVTSVQDEKYRDTMPEILDMLGERAVMGMDDITWISKAA